MERKHSEGAEKDSNSQPEKRSLLPNRHGKVPHYGPHVSARPNDAGDAAVGGGRGGQGGRRRERGGWRRGGERERWR
eukprot:1071922-Rhodomonas_salina.1